MTKKTNLKLHAGEKETEFEMTDKKRPEGVSEKDNGMDNFAEGKKILAVATV